jgi:hypothetical protein
MSQRFEQLFSQRRHMEGELNTGKDVQYHLSCGKCKLNPRRDATVCLLDIRIRDLTYESW